MKNMQKIFIFLICIVLVFGLVGCGTENDSNPVENASEASEYDLENESSEPVSTDEIDLETHTHEYAAEATKNAICLENGIQTYTCKCGDSYEEVIPALGHKFSSLKSIDNNEHQANCTRCNEVKTETHKTASKVTKKASCTTDGVKTYACECGYSFTETIVALGHNYTKKVIKPTATKGGYTEHTCSRCGDSYRDQYTQPEQSAEDIAVEKKANSIIAQIITKGMSDFDKAKAIHDYLVINIKPDETYSKRSLYNALIDNSCLCQGYALAFSYLCEKAGLNVLFIGGIVEGVAMHAWNQVQIDGEWYHVDCTYDDPIGGGDGIVDKYDYFLIPDEIIARNHYWTEGKKCTSWKYYPVQVAYSVEKSLKFHAPDATLEYCVEIKSKTELYEKIQDAYEHQYHIAIYWSESKAGLTYEAFNDIISRSNGNSGIEESYPGMDSIHTTRIGGDYIEAHIGPNPYK